MANIGTYFDDKIDFRCKEDIVKYSIKDNAIVVNYNMNPYHTCKEDHFDLDILRWTEEYPEIKYIFSNQIRISPNFLIL